MSRFRNDDSFQLGLSIGSVRLYTPTNTAEGYHTSRYTEALNQQIYAQAGCTKDILKQALDEIILRCNKQFDGDAYRTDIAAIANSLLYRLKYPVDEHCAIRLGAVLSFMEYEIEDGKTISEDPDRVHSSWQTRKEKLAMDYPEAYTFFLSMGVASTPEYRERLDILSDSDYFLNREKMIRSLMPVKS